MRIVIEGKWIAGGIRIGREIEEPALVSNTDGDFTPAGEGHFEPEGSDEYTGFGFGVKRDSTTRGLQGSS